MNDISTADDDFCRFLDKIFWHIEIKQVSAAGRSEFLGYSNSLCLSFWYQSQIK